MNQDMHIFEYDLHDLALDWEPDDPIDFEFWMTATIGDGEKGSNYQIHICTPTSIARLTVKRNLYMTDQWLGIEALIQELNAHIASRLARSTDDPYHLLAREWAWEYGTIR